jgi:CHAD domain-containing protein
MTGMTETRRFASEQADKLIGQLAYQMSRTRKSHDPGPVHDLRVSIRRFDQLFILLRGCFQSKDVKKIRRRLKDIMSQAGIVRNCDIALKLLTKSKLEEAAELQIKVRSRRKEAERGLLGMLRRWTERKSSLKWRSRLQTAPALEKHPLPATVEEAAMGKLPKMAKEFFARGKKAAHDVDSAAELHRFRLATKKFRYTLELVAAVYGPTMGARLENIKGLQSQLGAINDCATVREMIAGWNGSAGVEGELKKKQRKHIRRFQRLWTAEFAGHQKVRPWIEYLGGSGEPLPLEKKPIARSLSAAATEGAGARRQSRRA